MCVWCFVVEGHNGKNGKVGDFLVFAFPISCGRMGLGHDIHLFLDIGLCRAFLPSCVGEGRESGFEKQKLMHVP